MNPTREQVLEWQEEAARIATQRRKDGISFYVTFHEVFAALAYAAGKAEGAKIGSRAKVYCCYGMYVDVGHSEDCQHYRRPA